MPTYEYLCQGCNHRFEAWQKMIDEPLTICPACGGHIRRIFFPTGVVFKGGGFYKTDHAAASPASGNEGQEHHLPKSDGDKPSPDVQATSESKPKENMSPSAATEQKAPPTAATK